MPEAVSLWVLSPPLRERKKEHKQHLKAIKKEQ
jgi:hypothetical protein